MYDSNQNRFSDMQDPYANRPQRRASAMATGSICCAIVSIFCIMTGFFSVVFGSLAVLLSFLSKGKKDRLDRPALIGRGIGIATAIIGAVIIIYSVGFTISYYGSIENFYNSYIESLDESYGTDAGGTQSL